MNRVSCVDIVGEKMTLHAPNELTARIVLTDHLEMRVKVMTVHFDMESMPSALRTNSHHSALNFGPDWKNCVIRDHAASSLNRQPSAAPGSYGGCFLDPLKRQAVVAR
jgi:hypothetical protein